MSVVSARLGFASALAVLFFAGAVHAQSVPYWTSAWPGGFGSLTSDPSANGFGNFSSRYNFENGWVVRSEGGNLGFGANGFSPVSAFGSSAFTYEGAQAGYNFKSAPVSIYAGFDTLKYDT